MKLFIHSQTPHRWSSGINKFTPYFTVYVSSYPCCAVCKWLFTLSSLNYHKSKWVTAFSSHITRINIYCPIVLCCIHLRCCMYSWMCVCMFVFMYIRTIALLELMLIKPTLNKIYFRLLYDLHGDNGVVANKVYRKDRALVCSDVYLVVLSGLHSVIPL